MKPAKTIDFMLSSKAGILLPALVMILSSHKLFAQSPTVKSVYMYNSKNYSIVIPDSIEKKLPENLNGLEFQIGHLYYTNYYTYNCSKTDIEFKESKGIQAGLDGESASYINNLNQNSYTLIQNGTVKNKIIYFMPELTATKTEDSVNGYRSMLYTYENEKGILFKLWFSKELPFSVSPGFYFQQYGGITRIEYKFQETIWSLDLISYGNTDEPVKLQSKDVALKNVDKVRFPFFDTQ